MSQTLTTPAPGENEAVAPEAAPSPAPEVAGGSTDSTEVVPAERFNGLMSSFNRLQSESEARIAALEAEANSLRETRETPEVTEQISDPQIATLVEQNQALITRLAAKDAAEVKRAILEKYPEAKLFEDMLIGDDPEALEAVAATIAARLKPAEVPDPTVATGPPVAPEAAPVTPSAPAGGTVAPSAADVTTTADQLVDTIAARGGRGASPDEWAQYLALKAAAPESADLA